MAATATLVGSLALAPAAAGAASTASRAASDPYVTVGSAPKLPAGDRVMGALPSNEVIRADIVLTPRNAGELTALATEVATPNAQSFRHYLTPATFRAEFAPSHATVSAVSTRLAAAGVHVGAVSANGLILSLRAPAGTMARAFHTGLQAVREADGSTGYSTTSAPELPASIRSAVDSVVGLDQLITPQPLGLSHATAASSRTAAASTTTTTTTTTNATNAAAAGTAPISGAPLACATATKDAQFGSTYTDDQIAHSYGLDGLYSQGDLGSGQTVALFELDTFSLTDLATFEDCYFGTSHTDLVSEINIDGGEPSGPGEGEAALDVEDVAAYAPEAHIDVYDAPGTLSGWLDEMAAIVGQDQASVVNVSYGLCETDMEEAAPGLQQSENILFEEAALEGQSFMIASGDSGSETCNRDDGTDELSVSDPASEPFATAVGGTSLKSDGEPPTETVWNDGGEGGASGFGGDGGGGGGISKTWPMPAWQSAGDVLGVSNSYTTGSTCGAPSGTDCRELPDVSASADQAHGDTVVYGGSWTTIGGTSAAAPKWSAVIALTDALCSSEDLGPVGFVNPVLYRIASNPETYAEAFNDITQGNNDVLGMYDGTYPATAGFDMASGLGTPRVTSPSGGPGLASLLCSDGSSDTTTPAISSVSPQLGSSVGGTSVTLTGTNLTGVTAVQFGPASVPVTAGEITDGGTEITVDSPPSPVQAFGSGVPVGGVLVEASGPSGTSPPSDAATFHYVAGADGSPLPSVFYISPTSAQPGSTVTVYGSGFEEGLGGDPAPTVDFGGVAASDVTVVSDAELTAVVPAETGSTDCATLADGVPVSSICQTEVTVTNDNGTSATQPILPPPTGLVFDLSLVPAPGTENVPVVTEFDYAPRPVVTSVAPTEIGPTPALLDPFSSEILTLTGSGFNYFSLTQAKAVVPSAPGTGRYLTIAAVTPTSIEVTVPRYNPKTSTPPASVDIEVVSAGVTSTPVKVSIEPGNLSVSGISVHDGPTTGGTAVTVTGKNLSSAVGALFSSEDSLSTSSDITERSATAVTFLTPATFAGSGRFALCSVAICSGGKTAEAFTYYEPVRPTVARVSPGKGSAGGGESVVVTGTGLGGATAVKFGKETSTAVTSEFGRTTELVVAAPPGVIGSTVPVVVETAAGTSRKSSATFRYVRGAPGPVQSVRVHAATGVLKVRWTPPVNDGGSPITSYSVRALSRGPYALRSCADAPKEAGPTVRVGPSADRALLPVLPGESYLVCVISTSALGSSSTGSPDLFSVKPGDYGYAVTAADGLVKGYGALATLPRGSGGLKRSPLVGIAVQPLEHGYWTLAADGKVEAHGVAGSYGSLDRKQRATPPVAIVSTTSGGGYYVISAGGGVFPFGTAVSHGSITRKIASSITSAAVDHLGTGYWLAEANGSVFSFGTAGKFGSLRHTTFSGTVVAILPTATGKGYWLVTSTGRVYPFGDAKNDGSWKLKAHSPVTSIVGAAVDPLGDGYWLIGNEGSVKAFGRAHFEGDPAGRLESAATAIGA